MIFAERAKMAGTAASIKMMDMRTQTQLKGAKYKGSWCQRHSLDQKFVSDLNANTHKPEGVKIGWCHQSENGFTVQPKKCILGPAPVRSPKWILHHAIHAAIGKAAIQNKIARDFHVVG